MLLSLSLKKLITFMHTLNTYILFIFFDKFLVQQIMIHYTKILLDWAEEYFQHRQNNIYNLLSWVLYSKISKLFLSDFRKFYSKVLVWFKKQTTRDGSELHEKRYKLCLLLLGVCISCNICNQVVHQSTEGKTVRLTIACTKQTGKMSWLKEDLRMRLQLVNQMLSS